MLADPGAPREAALARLHEMLVRIARTEVGRRAPRLRLTGPELDDLAYQAAADAPCTCVRAARAVKTSTACWPRCTTKPPDRCRLFAGAKVRTPAAGDANRT